MPQDNPKADATRASNPPSGRRRIMACVSALDGLSVPDELLRGLDAHELRWSRGAPETVHAGDCIAFPLLWVDKKWDDAISCIDRMTDRSMRERTVVVGRAAPADIGPRLRAVGALTYIKEELSSWLIELIENSLTRLQVRPDKQWWDGLKPSPNATPTVALDMLQAVARLARDLLDANAVEILVRDRSTAEVCILESQQQTAMLVPWHARSTEDPTVFFDAAELYDGQVVVPDIDHAARFAERATNQHGAAIATLVPTTDDWRVALLLRWSAPFLPNAAEIGTLQAMSAIAATAWTCARFSMSTEALGHLGSFVRHATAAAQRMGPERALVDACARIAHASVALIMLRDTEEAPDRLHFLCDWRADERMPKHRCSDLRLPCPPDSKAWREAIIQAVTPLSAPLEVSHVLMLPSDHMDVPKGAVVLLAKASKERPFPELLKGLRSNAAEDLVTYGWPLVERLGETFAQTVADKFSRKIADHPTEQTNENRFGSEEVRGLLARAAEIVHRELEADQVFITFGADAVSFPPAAAALRVQAGPDSLTNDARKRNTIIRLLDVEDTGRQTRERINDDSFHKLLQTLGWDQARSVIIAPIAQDRGMVKVYTKASGRFLTRADVGVVTAVSERVRTVAGPLIQRAALHSLNSLANKLTGFFGEELGRRLVTELEQWTERYIKPGCRIFIYAQSQAGEPIIASASSELKHLQDQLAALHMQTTVSVKVARFNVLIERFLFPENYGLRGAVFFCHMSAFTEEVSPLVLEAGREVALLLHAEAVRQKLLQWGGILRHGLLGPVQGVISNAQLIVAQLEESGTMTEELAEGRRLIRKELAAIRLWRAENRLVTSLQGDARPQIRTTRSSLRKFLEGCVDRFRDEANQRNLTLNLMSSQRSMAADFDPEALDIAFSNLIDNAIKYAFFNREVSVGIQQDRHEIQVWFEDIGHGIPEERREEIYEPGKRAGQRDPFRLIRGDGLGLYLARKIAEAHGGTLNHTCELVGKQSGDTTPYRVRFTLTLPGN